MDFHIKTIVIVVLSCVLTLGIVKIAKAEAPSCKLEQPYRCVPIKGNAIRCGCGL